MNGVWIIPKSIMSAFALDTEALISDSTELSEVSAQSLIARSKPLPPRTWLRKWKRDTWMRHLSGRILKPSLGVSFAEAYGSFLGATPASHSAQQESASDPKTPATSGPSSGTESGSCSQTSCSSRTSMATYPSGCEMSLPTWLTSDTEWKACVASQRGEYSRRLKSAPPTNASESSSWPPASARDWKDSPGMATEAVNPDGSHRDRKDQLARAVYTCGQPDQTSPSTDGSRQGLWPTPASATANGGAHGLDGGSGARSMIPQEVAAKMKGGTLNPRWVETLMGIPIGWTMPSCTSPVTPGSTSYDSSETESFPQPPQEPSPS